MTKRKIVRAILKLFHGWNSEIHQVVEEQVIRSYQNTFVGVEHEPEKKQEIIKRMREIYYQRLMTTGAVFVGFVSMIVAFIALIVSLLTIIVH